MNGTLLCFQKFLLKKFVYNRKARLKIDSAASTGNHGKYNKYVSFLWPSLVAAHDHKKHARVLLRCGSYWLYKNTHIPRIHLCTSDSTFPFQLRRRRFPTKLP